MSTQRVVTTILVASIAILVTGFGLQLSGNAQALPQAQTGETIPYSGYLSDQAGQPVVDGVYEFRFTLYASAAGGEALWTETQAGVPVQQGAFKAGLGTASPLPENALVDGIGWLEIGVRGPDETEFTLLAPRQILRSAPTAVAACAHTHWGETWSGSGVGLHLISSNDTAIWAESFGGYAGIDARSITGIGVSGTSTSGAGVVGKTTVTTGDTTGVWGEVASGGVFPTYARGVVGWATKTTGLNYGVWGQSQSSNGTGVYGYVQNAGCTAGFSGTCAGLSGKVDSGNGVVGVTNNGTALLASVTGSGKGLEIWTQGSGNLIEAYTFFGADLKFKVSNAGNVTADGSITPGGADMAEMLPAVSGLEPGDVLVIGPDGQLTACSMAYQNTVVGVYSTQPGFIGGGGNGVDLTGKVPLAVIGVVPVKVSAENGAIHPGDLLTTASLSGHAMKAGSDPAVGTIIGKALAVLENGTGVILMLVMLQ